MNSNRARNISHLRMITRCKVINETMENRSMSHHAINDIDFLIAEIESHLKSRVCPLACDAGARAAPSAWPMRPAADLMHDLTAAADHLHKARELLARDSGRALAKVHISQAFKSIMDHVIAAEAVVTDLMVRRRDRRLTMRLGGKHA